MFPVSFFLLVTVLLERFRTRMGDAGALIAYRNSCREIY